MLGVLYSALSNSKLRDVGSVRHVHVRHLGACCVVWQRLLHCAAQGCHGSGLLLGRRLIYSFEPWKQPEHPSFHPGVVLLCAHAPQPRPAAVLLGFWLAPTGHTCHQNGGWCVLLPWHGPAVSVTGPAG